ncbi:MAG: hypothetical protein R3Y13_01990 [bacterium]
MNKYILEKRSDLNNEEFCKDMIYNENEYCDYRNQYILKSENEYFAQVTDYKNWSEPELFIIIKESLEKYSYKEIVKSLKSFFCERKEINLTIASSIDDLIVDDCINIKRASYSNFGEKTFMFDKKVTENIIIDGINVKYSVGSESEISCDFVSQNINDNKIIDKFLELKKGEYIYFKIKEIKHIEGFEFQIATLNILN